MKGFYLSIILFVNCWAGLSQVSLKTSMICGTQNKKARQYFESGNYGLQINKLSEAKTFYIAAVRLDSNFCDAWDNLSVCCRRMGNYQDAFIAALHSVMIDSTNPVAWLNSGYASFLSDNMQISLLSFDHMQRIIPDDPEGYYGKSMVLYSMDSIHEARLNLDQAEKLYKNKNIRIGSEVYLLRGFIAYKCGDKIEAQKIFKKIYSKFQENAELNFYYGTCILENENDQDKSQKYFDRAKKLGYIVEKD